MGNAERAEHYRQKASQVRDMADSLNRAESKQFLLTVEGDYLMLAAILERARIPDPLPASE